ncbi:MAG TPA: hypothetical protein VHA52_02245 [Candidatus Babeliaceae bacterium]|nr:hypothetical protein [Candidatus Babeliaceae bacterium]
MVTNNNFRLNGLNPLAYMGVNPQTPVPFFSRPSDPTSTDYQNFLLGTIWLNTTTQAVWMLVSIAGNEGTWVKFSSSSGNIETLTGDTGGPISPVANNINILSLPMAGSSVSFSGTASTSTIALNTTDANANTIIGHSAGNSSITGENNTALGFATLNVLTSGNDNVAIGESALTSLDSGTRNVAVGTLAGESITDGGSNVLIGRSAGGALTTGLQNILIGDSAGDAIIAANNNIALGANTLGSLTSGNSNIALGSNLGSLLTGTANIAIGVGSGTNYTSSESNNILINNTGIIGDSGVIRIGNGNQTSAYIAGVSGVSVSNQNFVTIDTSTGQLGSVVNPSSNTFKSINTQVFTTSGTYTPTSGMLYCIIEALGGGGGGGGTSTTSTSQTSVGGAGGGGSYCRLTASAALIGVSQTITIGAGGSAGSTGGGAGGNGGTTTVGSLLSAGGGSGGDGGAVEPDQWPTQGGGGGTATGGDINVNGQSGSQGWGTINGSFGGRGADSYFGAGGLGPTATTTSGTPAPGFDALGYGSGGSGSAIVQSMTGQIGGAGAPGIVIITEYIS